MFGVSSVFLLLFVFCLCVGIVRWMATPRLPNLVPLSVCLVPDYVYRPLQRFAAFPCLGANALVYPGSPVYVPRRANGVPPVWALYGAVPWL